MKHKQRDIRWLPGLNWVTLFFFVFLYVPLIILIVFSFNGSRSATVWEGFSLEWYAKAFANDDIRRAAKNSLIIAFFATIFSTAIATMGALALGRNAKIKRKDLFTGTILLPLMIPEIVTAIATLTLFAAIGLSLGLGNIIIAHTVFCIPFAYLPIRARLDGMDETLEQAAHDLYADDWTTFRLVTFPLLLPGILAGAMLAFIISLDDFIITMMVAEAGSTTLPIYIYSLVRVGVTPEINAVSTILIGISVAIVLLTTMLTLKNTAKKPHGS